MLGVTVVKTIQIFVDNGPSRATAKAVINAASSELCSQYKAIVDSVMTLPTIAAD